MIHEQGIRASSECSPLARALERAAASWGGYQGWRRLDADRRLRLIEQALRTTDGIVDDFSLAL